MVDLTVVVLTIVLLNMVHLGRMRVAMGSITAAVYLTVIALGPLIALAIVSLTIVTHTMPVPHWHMGPQAWGRDPERLTNLVHLKKNTGTGKGTVQDETSMEKRLRITPTRAP